MGMASRGHRVHFICSAVPGRLDRFQPNVFFHEVEVKDHPVFVDEPYDLALASKMVEVVTYEKLDILHVHYAVPHATSAYLARQILGTKAPKVITTLHGTDITLVGNDRSFLPITRFSIMESDAVTAPSKYLKQVTYDKLNVPTDVDIEVISNFVDTNRFIPKRCEREQNVRSCLGIHEGKDVLLHISNFRRVKRVDDVVKVFALVLKEKPAHLVLVGDGPERSGVEALVHELGLHESVSFLGKQESLVELIQCSKLFILPSKNESFGLAALEAMSCGIPVIASKAEGIPEVVLHGEVGFLSDVGDVADMAKNALRLMQDPKLYGEFSNRAREITVTKYQLDSALDRYQELYERVLA